MFQPTQTEKEKNHSNLAAKTHKTSTRFDLDDLKKVQHDTPRVNQETDLQLPAYIHSAHSNSACSSTVFTASSCKSGGFFHGSSLRGGGRGFAPDAGEGGLDLSLEAGEQFAVGGHQRLLGFDLRHDRVLRGEGWEGD